MGLKKNVSYSVLLTLSTYMVPLFVFPYISRVLLPSGIGTVDFVESIVNYSILVSMMGMSTLGIREIAKNRDNRARLDSTFSDLFALNILSTVIVVVILVCLTNTIPQLHRKYELMCIGIVKVVFNLFWIEWFFKGIENFKYITLRSVAVRIAFIVSVFLFVHDSGDAVIYYALFVGMTVCNAVCNWNYRRRYVSLHFKGINLRRYIKPFVFLGLFALMSAVYTQLNTFYLGMVADDVEVGYYTVSTRLYSVLIALFSAMTGVMIPHMSVLVRDSKFDEIKTLTNKTFKLLFIFSLPLIIYLEIFAEDFIRLVAGEGYEGATVPIRIVMPLLLIIGSEQIFILQLLIPGRKDSSILKSAVSGVAICVLINLLMTRNYGAVGSALAWTGAEFAVLFVASCAVKRYMFIDYPFGALFRSVIYAVPYVAVGMVVLYAFDGYLIRLFVAALFYFFYAVFLLCKMLNVDISGLIRRIRKR